MKKRPAVVASVAAFTLIGTPAFAAPYPDPDAKAELETAVTATNAAPSYQYRRNDLGWTSAYNAAGQYQSVAADEQRVFNGVGNFHQIQWPSNRARNKVQGPDYLDNSSLRWELTVGPNSYEYPQWTDLLSERLGRIDSIANLNFITAADKTVSGADTVYRVGDGDFFEYVYTVNAAGRITRLEITRGNRIPETGKYETWEYVPVSVVQPSADTVAPIATVRRAIQAATLNATIRSLAKGSARTGNAQRQSLRKLRVWSKEAVGLENAAGDGSEDEPIPRYVKIRIADVPGGVRIFRKNPYTGTMHEWRIGKRGGQWKAFRTKP